MEKTTSKAEADTEAVFCDFVWLWASILAPVLKLKPAKNARQKATAKEAREKFGESGLERGSAGCNELEPLGRRRWRGLAKLLTAALFSYLIHASSTPFGGRRIGMPTASHRRPHGFSEWLPAA